jgi:hypothetical protein
VEQAENRVSGTKEKSRGISWNSKRLWKKS